MLWIIEYLFKLSITLAIVWLFYQLVLRRLTFYNSNRWYLLGYTFLSFLIPFINISPVVEATQLDNNNIIRIIPSVQTYTSEIERITESPAPLWSYAWDKWDWAMLIIVAGAAFLLVRFLFRFISYLRLRSKATLVYNGKVKLYEVEKNIIPFSFGDSIFINRRSHSNDELQEIIRHEFIHVKQKHTVDIIWAEVLCMLNWYNPFAWLLKISIRQNLEFIADNKVLENGINRKQYQYLLLKVTGNNHFSIAQKFNFSSLKKRIAMMNKLKTAKIHMLRFLFLVPLLAVILVSFRKQISDQKKQDSQTQKEKVVAPSEWTSQPPAAPKGPTSLTEFVGDTIPGIDEPNEKGYLFDFSGKKNDYTIVIKDKNGKVVERVPYEKWQENAEMYENIYGELPPPPVPPLPANPPNPPNPPQPMQLPDNVKKIEIIDGKKATLVLKDGSTERYDLNKPEEKAAFEKKYGEIIPPLPPKSTNDSYDRRKSEFLKRNTDVENLGWVFNNRRDNVPVTMHVIKKDGVKEKYNLEDRADKAKAEKKYGELPIPETIPQPAYFEKPELSAAQEANRARIADHIEITDDNKAYIRLKNGSVEEYDLANKEERKKFETKYGKIIEVKRREEGSDEPVTVVGYPSERNISNEPITVIGYPAERNSSNEPVTVVGYPSKRNVSSEPITAISAEGTRSVIAPTKVSAPREGGVTFLDDHGNIVGGEEDVLVTITNKTTKQELDELVKKMKEKGIELKFDNMNYDNGKLTQISGKMKYKKSESTFSVTDFKKLILSKVTDGDHIYMKVRTNDEKQVI